MLCLIIWTDKQIARVITQSKTGHVTKKNRANKATPPTRPNMLRSKRAIFTSRVYRSGIRKLSNAKSSDTMKGRGLKEPQKNQTRKCARPKGPHKAQRAAQISLTGHKMMRVVQRETP